MASYASDEDLRTELLKYGINTGPITVSTKDVYLRKLQKLRASPNVQSRRSLQGFSSDESESENNHANRGRPNVQNWTTKTVEPKPTATRNLRQRRSMNAVPSRSTENNNFTPPTPVSASQRRRSLSRIEAKPAPPVTRKSLNNSSRSKTEFSSSESDSGDDSADEVHEDSYRSANGRLGDLSHTGPNLLRGTPQQFKSPADSHPRTSTPARPPVIKHYMNSHGLANSYPLESLNRKYDTPIRDPAYFDTQFYTTDNFPATSNKSQWISMLLVGVALFFFLGLGVIYMGLLRGENGDNSTDSSYVDLLKVASSQPAFLQEDRRQKVVLMSQNIIHLLQARAGQHECSWSEDPPPRNMSLKEMEQHLISMHSGELVLMREALSLLINNPSLGVKLYDSNGRDILSSNGKGIVVDKIDDISLLEAEKAWKSFTCRLSLAIAKVMYKITLALAVLVSTAVVILVGTWTWMNKKEERQQVLLMVDRILDVLQQHENASQGNAELQPYLAIPHVRDMLIPPAERSARQKIWDKAVQFLEENESRVRVECQEVEGETFQVWRWLPKVESQTKTNSLWQGEAFQHNESGGMNSPMYSPSSCLKIRNMFDHDEVFGDDWVPPIKKAILEKCSHINGITHVEVDASSQEGCVYVKCTSPDSAARVFRALHGSWYDGKLVTVRYLRDERYLQRYPDAAKATTPLRIPV